MEEITLNKVKKKGNAITYDFSVTAGLSVYFSGKPFEIIYPDNVESVPDAIAAIPFVCCVLPLVWLSDAVLSLPELDKDFYDSIPAFKQGYIKMYPDAVFRGTVAAERLINCKRDTQEGSATLFSGGLDATTTMLRHLSEKPTLISIWGSDIPYDNVDGWQPIQTAIDNVAVEYGLCHANIRSSFRSFDLEEAADRSFYPLLHDWWWHAVKHGITLIGHTAPYMWQHGLRTVYIASSYSPADGKVTCASDPTIDNFVRFCGCNTVHDGFELSRQDKADYVVQHHRTHPKQKIQLHVCWETKDGHNCCRCEKCYRTMVGIWVAGGDPAEFGFVYDADTFGKIRETITMYPQNLAKTWMSIQKGFRENQKMLRGKSYYRQIRWIGSFNFANPEKNWCRKKRRIRYAVVNWKETLSKAFPKTYARYRAHKQRK